MPDPGIPVSDSGRSGGSGAEVDESIGDGSGSVVVT